MNVLTRHYRFIKKYWQAHEQIEESSEQEENTDLNGILDQNELGGAKNKV